MADATEIAYDEFAYPSDAIVDTHPRRLATIAMLYGMQPAPPSRCRVLELGCGAGGNLISMAFQAPQSEFVGIDLSGRSIEAGNRQIAEIGLANVELRHCDIMQFGKEFGTFDYIVAHGVYSWVPPHVRERVLEICKTHLAPQGVGYVSYNAYPGAFLRDVARDLMRFHTRDTAPAEVVEVGRAIVKAAGEASAGDSLHGLILRTQSKELEERAADVIYHDDLSSGFTPFMLHEVATAASRHGLQYLGDTVFGHSQMSNVPAEARNVIARIPQDRQVDREQYIDFIVGRSFRRSLLCHDDIVLDRNVGPQRIQGYFVAGDFSAVDDGVDPLTPGKVSIKGPRGTLQTDHAATKVALLHLGAMWPQCIAFGDLAKLSVESLLAAGLIDENGAGGQVTTLAAILFQVYAARALDLYGEPPALTVEISEHPEVSRLARIQAEYAANVSTLRHGGVALENNTMRFFLKLVDGTRTVDALLEDLNAALEASRPEGEELARATRAEIEKNLRDMARLGLLVR